jgi:hypothetical protein
MTQCISDLPIDIIIDIVRISSDSCREHIQNKLVCKDISTLPCQFEMTFQETFDSDIAKIMTELVYIPSDMYKTSVGEVGATRRLYQFSEWRWHFLGKVPYVEEDDE